jgi:hypothetical protein
MTKEQIIEETAKEICKGVNKQETRKKEEKLEPDMLTNFGVLGLLTPLQISEAFYNGFDKLVLKNEKKYSGFITKIIAEMNRALISKADKEIAILNIKKTAKEFGIKVEDKHKELHN